MSEEPKIAHYRKLELAVPCTLTDLETYCATLRAHHRQGDQYINCGYQVTLAVRIDEPVLP